jgi:predicted nucleic acid-binding protein
MHIFYFDSSALAKAYVKEKGSNIAERILKNTTFKQWRVLMLGLLETVSILVRKKNSGVITNGIFSSSLQALRNDFIDNSEVLKIEATNEISLAARPLIEKHSINATDAVVLHTAVASQLVIASQVMTKFSSLPTSASSPPPKPKASK